MEHKSVDCLDPINHTCEQKCACVHVCACSHICLYMDKAHTYVQKHEHFHMYAYGHICCVYVNKCT